VEQEIEKAVKRAITTMRENIGEPLTVDDMARSAMFSKFHFTRIFQRVTGVSPGRFLSALRLQQAQRLLVSTSLNVADISQQVGYNSVGTFSTRFSRSVGMSPTTYRRRAGFTHRIASAADDGAPAPSQARVHGRIAAADDNEPRMVFAGLFEGCIPEGRPVRCAVLSQPGLFTLGNVPAGTWYLLAQSVPGSVNDPDGYRANINESVWVASHGPLVVRPDASVRVDLSFAPVQTMHPPVLMALLDVREFALDLVQQRAAAYTRHAAPAHAAYSPERHVA
jgi:AraC-like DNA-binding protein